MEFILGVQVDVSFRGNRVKLHSNLNRVSLIQRITNSNREETIKI